MWASVWIGVDSLNRFIPAILRSSLPSSRPIILSLTAQSSSIAKDSSLRRCCFRGIYHRWSPSPCFSPPHTPFAESPSWTGVLAAGRRTTTFLILIYCCATSHIRCINCAQNPKDQLSKSLKSMREEMAACGPPATTPPLWREPRHHLLYD